MGSVRRQAELYLGRALELSLTGSVHEARSAFALARDAFEQSGDRAAVARTLIEEARLLARTNDRRLLDGAFRSLRIAEDIVCEYGGDNLRADLLHVRGYSYLRTGRPGPALACLLDAERAFRAARDALGESRVLDTLGVLWDRRGDRERAALLIARSLALKQAGGDEAGVAISLGNLGRLALRSGRIDEAERFFALDLERVLLAGDRRAEATVRVNLSECSLRAGDIAGAREHAERARKLAEELDDSVALGFALIACSNVEDREGKRETAVRLAGDAERNFEEAGMLSGVGFARLAEARLMAATGELVSSAALSLRAAHAAKNGLAPDIAIEALLEAYRNLERAGDRSRSRRILDLAHRVAMRHGIEDQLERIDRAQTVEDAVRIDSAEPIVVRIEEGVEHFDGVKGALGFRVESFLGHGQFGVVLKVREVPGGQTFALKRLIARPGSGWGIEVRFRREFLAMSRVRGAHLVRVFAYGLAEGRPCLLLENIESGGHYRTLEDVVRDGQRSTTAFLVERCKDVALALATLHGAGLIHRDLKPSNVLIDRAGRAVVTDYGLVYDLRDENYVPSAGFKGTLAYGAPELIFSVKKARQPGPEADLYSLGVILYRGLSGEWPHAIEESSGDLAGLFRRKSLSPQRPLSQLRADLPPSLTRLVSELLNPDPEKRPREAKEVAAELTLAAEEVG